MEQQEIQQQTRDLYKRCVVSGGEGPYETAEAIDRVIGGLTRVDFDPNKRLRVYNHVQNVGIPIRGLNKRQKGRLNELVMSLYDVAESGSEDGFDPTRVSKVRIEEGRTPISTRHYKKGIKKKVAEMRGKYLQ